jgi:serine/threonine protein kinase
VVLESEVQVLGRLRHPNVVKLYDVIDANSILCLVLELVEVGRSTRKSHDKVHVLYTC